MAIINGWVDWAERHDGPFNKQFRDPNAGIGICCHSVVGDLPNHAVPGRFLDANDAASCMFILYRDGHLVQMYPVTSSTWTSGSYAANVRYWAVEAEGGGAPDYGEKLTRAAADTFIRLVTEWEQHTGNVAHPGVNILQHKDLVRLYGGGATACASDRYSEAWERIASGERYDDMTPEERAKLEAVYAALTGGDPSVLEDWNQRGNSLLAGYAIEQQKLGEHIANHAAGVTGPVADHTHEPGGVRR